MGSGEPGKRDSALCVYRTARHRRRGAVGGCRELTSRGRGPMTQVASCKEVKRSRYSGHVGTQGRLES